MRILKESFLLLSLFGLLTAFSPSKKGIDVTYGVCNSENSTVKLELNDDYTFEYIDRSNPNNPIEVEGTYELKNNRVKLRSNDSGSNFHSNWKIVNEGQNAKARKGLSFYRLGKLE